MNNKKVLFSVVGLVVLLAVVAAGTYAYLQNKNDNGSKTTNPGEGTSNQNNTGDNGTAGGEGSQNEGEPVRSTSYKSEKGVAITLTAPERGGKVASPLTVTGSVPGTWSFEGQFSVRLLDADSNVLAEGPAKLDGDWMSENQVPFTATLNFQAPAADSAGLLVLQKANPSGMEDKADSLTVPVQF